jgi:O-antigen ligase
MVYLLGGYVWLFIHRPFEVWPALGTLQIERVYGILTILVWFVSPNKGFVSNRLHLALAISTFALVVSWVLSPFASMPGCTEVVENYAKVVIIYVLMVTTVRDEKNLRILLTFFVGSVALYASHSLLEWFNGRYQFRMGIPRMTGVDTTFSDPNAFASGLLYSLPMLLPFWQERPRRIPRFLMVAYVMMVMYCILKTGSRAAFVGVSLFVVILIITSAKRKVQAILACGMAGMVGLVVLAAVLPDELKNRYLSIIDPSYAPPNALESADGRIDGIVLGFKLWQTSPLFGTGPATFVLQNSKGLQPHNVYGQVLSELGLCGVLGLLAMVVSFFWNWRESRRLVLADPYCDPAHDFTYQVARAVGINVILLLVMGAAGHNLFRYNWQWFAAFSVIALHCLRTRAATAQAQQYQLLYAQAYPG